MALGDDPAPPTAALWSKYVGDGVSEESIPQGMALRMLYGIGTGAAVAVAFPLLGVGLALALAVGLCPVSGAVLAVVGMILWVRAILTVESEPKTVRLLSIFYPIYGGVLGAWLSSGLV